MKSTTEYMNILRDYMAKNASKYSITRMGIFGSVANIKAEYVCIGTYKG